MEIAPQESPREIIGKPVFQLITKPMKLKHAVLDIFGSLNWLFVKKSIVNVSYVMSLDAHRLP